MIRFMQLGTLQNFLTTDHWCSSLHDKKLNFLRDIFSVKLLLEVNQERPTFTNSHPNKCTYLKLFCRLKGIKIAESRRLVKSLTSTNFSKNSNYWILVEHNNFWKGNNPRRCFRMEGALHTDLWKSETNRDIKKSL